MQRVIGALLIITATSGAGYLYGADLKRYLDKMVYLRYIAGLIKGEMEYTGAPLPEIFRGIGSRVQEPYASWLKNISAEIDLREESAFARIWNRERRAGVPHQPGRADPCPVLGAAVHL